MMLAFTGLALALGGAFSTSATVGLPAVIGTWAGLVADLALVAASGYSAYSSNKAMAEQAKSQAEIQKMQAAAYGQQAADLERQAADKRAEAGVAQIQSEQEAERRSRIMASDIGSAYANAAANGLLVDGDSNDTFANVLKSTVGEAQRDISTVKDNARISMWERGREAQSLISSANTARTSGVMSLMGAQASLDQARNYKRAAWLGAATGGFASASSALSSAFGGASYAARKG